ncbi:DEAD/DEAH box helicase [Flectobacillus sp. DC10W]|uniref:DEAD/DEAH box helicase n=1 Tax=Flectobacillus longus TaxID=2984207 RepID=A0ABT6YNR5_9BACT|nr:DEAD/DEAH box helicase [Flectobacillus longus]MDI9865235.1 DEAD/DEAH box helicase [Flectobacillus longus]
MTFEDLNINTFLLNALNDLGLTEPTPIQEQVFSVVMSGRDVCGIAQTGTGKTYAYLLPALRLYQFSKEKHPQIIILVPTRELVVQVMESVKALTTYMTVRTVGIFGGVNTKPQTAELLQGVDILVATPGRLVDFLMNGTINPKNVKRLIIDEFDEMLNLGFRAQLTVIFDKLPSKRQNLLFSATLTKDVETLVETFFNSPVRIETEAVGTPHHNITQSYYFVQNFYTKVNLLNLLLKNDESMTKVLVFVSTKKLADTLYEQLQKTLQHKVDVIHSNKNQNHRFNSVGLFELGYCQVLIATDIIARGLDIDEVTHVINFDMPDMPENYIHRIGRTGRYDKKGIAISFVTKNEVEYLKQVETLMNIELPILDSPEGLMISEKLLEEEIPKAKMKFITKLPDISDNSAYHDKTDKNKKVNVRRDHKAEMKRKYGKSYENRSRKS